VNTLSQALETKLEIEYFDNPFSFYQNHTEADLSDTLSLLQWQPAWTLEQGMFDYISLLERGHRGPAETA